MVCTKQFAFEICKSLLSISSDGSKSYTLSIFKRQVIEIRFLIGGFQQSKEYIPKSEDNMEKLW